MQKLTEKELDRILDAIAMLQEFDLDTSTVTISLSYRLDDEQTSVVQKQLDALRK